MWQTHGDLIAEAQDWPEAQRFAERSKLLLPPPVLAAEEAKKESSPEVAQVKMQAQQIIQQKDQMMQAASGEIEKLRQENQKLTVAAQQATLKAQMATMDTQQEAIKSEQDALAKDYQIAKLNLQLQEQDAVQRVTEMAQQSQESTEPAEPAEPQMDVASILQAVASMQQPINITVPVQVDGKGAMTKTGRAVRQSDGSYLMESMEKPCNE
jgi:hypothetical protein